MIHGASLHIINPPRFRCATLILLLTSAGTNQSQETKSRNRIEKEEEKQDENSNQSKRRVKIQGYQKIKDEDFQRKDDQFQMD